VVLAALRTSTLVELSLISLAEKNLGSMVIKNVLLGGAMPS
jgi:hypothetical protein